MNAIVKGGKVQFPQVLTLITPTGHGGIQVVGL
jgi:hypothetical protein